MQPILLVRRMRETGDKRFIQKKKNDLTDNLCGLHRDISFCLPSFFAAKEGGLEADLAG